MSKLPNSEKMARGEEMEAYISGLLADHGVENRRMKRGHPFDIFTSSRLRVDVKSAWFPNNGSYSFGSWKTESKVNSDVYILVVVSDPPVVFIVPRAAMPANSARVPWPPQQKSRKNWAQWINRFDLLGGV